MTEGIYPFTIGDIECVVVNEAMRELGIEAIKQIFDKAPEDELEQAFNAYVGKYGNAGGAMNPLYIKTGDHKILVDVGFGTNAPDGLGNVIPNLAKIGVTPDDITDVIITHFHGDHINGLIDADNKALYPNANIIVNEAEFDFWMNAGERSEGAKLRLNAYDGKVRKTQIGDEIITGITTVEAYGHTPGQIGLMIESNGERLLHLADVAHALFQHEHPDWSPRFDSQPDISPITRKKWFKYAADEGILTMWYHFPFPGLGHVEHNGDLFTWKPLKS